MKKSRNHERKSHFLGASVAPLLPQTACNRKEWRRRKGREGLKGITWDPSPEGYTIWFHEYPLASIHVPTIMECWNKEEISLGPALKEDSADNSWANITGTWVVSQLNPTNGYQTQCKAKLVTGGSYTLKGSSFSICKMGYMFQGWLLWGRKKTICFKHKDVMET